MFEVAEVGQEMKRSEFAQLEPILRERLLNAQFQLATSHHSVVIVIAGVEGAGKGETVNLLMDWLDARGVAVHALNTDDFQAEARPGLYRFWHQLPPHGKIAIFFGSWYTRPIVDFVFGRIGKNRFENELTRIIAFEQMLTNENVLLLKFWLHITKKQQRSCLKILEADPQTAWRVTRQDWAFHKTYDEFRSVSSRALERTSTGAAMWTIVAAHDQHFRHATIAEKIAATLEDHLVTPPDPVFTPDPLPTAPEVNVIRMLDYGKRIERQAYEEDLAKYQNKLGRISRSLSASHRAVVAVFEGSDAAGKGGCIRRIVHSLDARFYRVIPIAAPSDEERARPYLWRFWRNLPEAGHWTIYDRSWYGRVLVERIEGLCKTEDWQRAYQEINRFEEQLVDSKVVVVKFWLAITAEEQLRRFKEREATGYKRYKLTDEDIRNREKWPAYEAAACDMITHTSSEAAPWILVEAEDKLHARIKVLKALVDRLS